MSHPRTRLAVVIVNYRTADLVTQCLAALLPELRGIDAAVLVVDNDSQDGSVDAVRRWLFGRDNSKQVLIIEAGANSGFSAGNNVGLCALAADYYLLLNSDTIVRPGAIRTLLRIGDTTPTAGIVSPRLEWPDTTPQESCFRYLSPVSEFILGAQTGVITSLLKRFDVPLPVGDAISRPQWTSFACVLLRGQMINETGLMDDGFFMYYEDVEFCRRAKRTGWQIVHIPQARVVHLRGGSSPVKKRALERKRLPRYYYAARTRYYYLAYGRLGLTLANLLWLLGRAISKSREIIEGRKSGVPEKQWRDIWTNWLVPSTPWSKAEAKAKVQ